MFNQTWRTTVYFATETENFAFPALYETNNLNVITKGTNNKNENLAFFL